MSKGGFWEKKKTFERIESAIREKKEGRDLFQGGGVVTRAFKERKGTQSKDQGESDHSACRDAKALNDRGTQTCVGPNPTAGRKNGDSPGR